MDEDERFEEIRHFNDVNSDMPDGAFFTMADEDGIGLDDWVWFSEQCEKRGTYKTKKSKK